MRTWTFIGLIGVAVALVEKRNLHFDHIVGDVAPKSRPTTRSIPPSHVLHERHKPGNTEGWVRLQWADPNATLPMRVGLRQSNLDRGHDLLMDM